MTNVELRNSQKQIYNHTSVAGSLADLGSVLVKFVYHLSPNCYFSKNSPVASEWVLKPKNWITLQFSSGRRAADSKVIVSLAVLPKNLEGHTTLEVTPGSRPEWSKFTVDHVGKLRGALDSIAEAHRIMV